MLKGKTAVVTGASGGMGEAICQVLAENGARIVARDLRAEQAALAVERLAGAGFKDAVGIAADVSSASDVARSFREVDAKVGRIDILVNNAGIRHIGGVLELDPADWDRTIAVNLNGPLYCAREAALRMSKSAGGSIVNIASVAGLIAVRSRPAYTASKHGLVGLTRSLAHELAPHNIRVNAIAPGVIKTPMSEAYFADPAFAQGLAEQVAMGRGGEATSVGRGVLYLCSELADFVTGVVLPIDGGFLAEKNPTVGQIKAFVGAGEFRGDTEG